MGQTTAEKFDAIFDERLGKIPTDYRPPEKKAGESWTEYYERAAEYDRQYMKQRKAK